MTIDTIENCDCMEYMRKIGGGGVDLTLTDIPYGVCNNRKMGSLRTIHKGDADDETFNVEDFMREVIRITKGSIYVFCGTEQLSLIRGMMDEEGMTTRTIVWEKTNPSPMNGQNIWLSGVEVCAFGRRKGAAFNAFCRNTVLRYPCGRGNIHPTQKPIELFEELVKVSSNEGDLVFDPCVGSGTTAVASARLGRHFIGCELNDSFHKIALSRFTNARNAGHQLELL